jgi:hypothetical protein
MAELSRAGKRCLYISSEDDGETVVRKRIEVLGGDMDNWKISMVVENHLTPEHERVVIPADATTARPLEELIKAFRPDFVCFNPLTAYVPRGRNLYHPQDARALMSYLGFLAREHRFAALVVRHFGRRKLDDSPETRALGSVDLTNAVRCSWYVVPHPDFVPDDLHPDVKQILVTQSKNNIGVWVAALAFELRKDYFAWVPTRDITYTEAVTTGVLAQTTEARQVHRDTSQWLEAMFALHGGKELVLREDWLFREAVAAGFGAALLRAVRSNLFIKVEYSKGDRNRSEAMWRWAKERKPQASQGDK